MIHQKNRLSNLGKVKKNQGMSPTKYFLLCTCEIGLKRNGKNAICQQNVRSKLGPKPNNFSQNKTTQINTLHLEPVDIILIDWCHIQGKTYLVSIDHSSGFIWAKQSTHKNTKQCLKILKNLFSTIRFPKILENSAKHSTSSPFNPIPNNLAES